MAKGGMLTGMLTTPSSSVVLRASPWTSSSPLHAKADAMGRRSFRLGEQEEGLDMNRRVDIAWTDYLGNLGKATWAVYEN